MAYIKSTYNLKSLIRYLNKNKKANCKELVEELNLTYSTVLYLSYRLADLGLIFKYGDFIETIERIDIKDKYVYTEIKEGDEYFKERLDRCSTDFTDPFLKHLTILECLYIARNSIEKISSLEFSDLINKHHVKVSSVMKTLERAGYLERNGIYYSFKKDIPIVKNQAKFLRDLEDSNKDMLKIEKKPIVEKKADLSWIDRYVKTFKRTTKKEKQILKQVMYSAATCI